MVQLSHCISFSSRSCTTAQSILPQMVSQGAVEQVDVLLSWLRGSWAVPWQDMAPSLLQRRVVGAGSCLWLWEDLSPLRLYHLGVRLLWAPAACGGFCKTPTKCREMMYQCL